MMSNLGDDLMADKHIRSLTKGISWRFIATLTTMTLVFLFTGDLSLSLGIGVFDVLLKLLFYYLHERAWNNITWGRTPN